MDRLEKIAGMVRIAAIADRLVAGKWEPPEGRRRTWRRQTDDGTWEYSETPPKEEGTSVRQEETEQKKKTKVEKKEAPRHRENRVHLGKDDLKSTLSKGHYSIVSAGRNPNDPKEAKMDPDDPFFHERHEKLKDELEKRGFRYTDVVGHYGGKEASFMVFHDGTELTPKTRKSVMVHHADEKAMKDSVKAVEEIGKRFNQDSVLHGAGGKNELVFTAGEKKGKKCGGEGWKETPEAEDYYTDIELKGREHTKFNLDISGCFKEGLL